MLLALCATTLFAGTDEQTVGLFVHDEAAHDGYTLFAPMEGDKAYLIDMDGKLVNSWESDFRFTWPVYLLENGDLMRPAFLPLGPNPTIIGGGRTGRVEKFSWDGELVWEFEYMSKDYVLHHDIEVLPNGNVLMMAWERKTFVEAIQAGRNQLLVQDGELWPEHIIEVEPTGDSGGNIVWEWHAWDHLVQDYDPLMDNYGVVAEHPELIDINFFESTRPERGEADWHHANSLDYNEELDQIVMSVRHFSEIWVIDHSTTTEEAASHSGGNSGKGGDLLYRWGNPQAYDAGGPADQQLFVQHDARWIERGFPGEGNILIFNNGTGRADGDYSTVDEIVPPVDVDGNYALTPGEPYSPEAPVWTYVADNPEDFYSAIVSGAERMPNGNTLIAAGSQGAIFEVSQEGEEVWRYVNPVTAKGPLRQGVPIPPLSASVLANIIFRAPRYSPEFPGLQGKDLTAGDFIELPAKEPSLDTDGDGILNADDLDDDNDGCLDAEEDVRFAGSEQAGGKRNPHDFWDFYDVWTNPSAEPDGWERNAVIDMFDIMALVARFGARAEDLPPASEAVAQALTPPADEDSYHIAYDRGPPAGQKGWDVGPPDGVITIPFDVLGMMSQFGHQCLGALSSTSATPPTTTPAP